MRLKSNPTCCAFAWSPQSFGTPAMIAAASLNGAMSDDFGSDATLSIYLADTTQTDEEAMRVVGHITIPDRACRVDWSTHTGAQGVIAVACANGSVYIYSAAKVLQSAPPAAPADGQHALLWTITEHAGGAVRGCQLNASQPNCLATGGDDGRWFVWSLPASAADKAAPQKVAMIANSAHNAAIVDLRWHAKNTYIIATASADGVVKVWNLSNEKLASSLNVQRASHGAGITSIAWHPTAATLAVGLDDPYPVVQIWELRKAMAPTVEMKGHERGVTGISWSAQNPDMLASCDAVGHTFWWDVQTGEKSGELLPESNYVADVQWCPVTPGVLATSSFEPLLCVSTAQSAPSASGAAPEWMKRPCGASINVLNVVASLVPGTDMTLQLTRLRDEPLPPSITGDELSQHELSQLPAGSPELQHWLDRHGYPVLSAMSASRADRQPILHYLDQANANDTAAGNGGADSDDPFAELAQEQEKSYEERAAEMVAKGQIEEAVDLCLNEMRFDDAFALAMLRGVDLVNKTRDAYVQYIAQAHPERRHVLYAGAIATGNYGALIRGNLPWREALSAIVSFAGDDFANACNELGDVLKAQGETDGAYTCYVCSRNVDAVIELWRQQGVPHAQVVRDAHVLEETAERRCTHPFLADCLAELGTHLLYGGQPTQAVAALQRAAEMGQPTAQKLVDRVKYCVPGAAPRGSNPPYTPETLSDQPSQKAQEWMMQRQAAAAAAAAAAMPPAPPAASVASQPTPMAPSRFTPPAAAAPAGYVPSTGMPVANSQNRAASTGMAPLPPQQPTAAPFRPTPNATPLPTPVPGMAPHTMAAPTTMRPPLMPGAASLAGVPPQSAVAPAAPPRPGYPGAGGVAAPAAAMGGAPMRANMPPPPPPGAARQPGASLASGGSGMLSHIPTPVGPPQPRLMPHPVSSFSSMRAGSTPGNSAPPAPGGSRAGSQPYPSAPQASNTSFPSSMGHPQGGSFAGSHGAATPMMAPPAPASAPAPQQQQPMAPPTPAVAETPQVYLANLNPTEIGHPAGNQMIQRLQQILPQIPDQRRRAAIEQSAVQLFYALRAQQIPEDLVQALYQLVCNAGSPTVRTMWSQLSTRYAQLVQPFANLRFL